MGLAPSASNRGVAYFNLGCGYSRLGKKEKALKALEQAVAAGFANRWSYETHAALVSLRAEPRFQQLLARLQNPCPNKSASGGRIDFKKKKFPIYHGGHGGHGERKAMTSNKIRAMHD